MHFFFPFINLALILDYYVNILQHVLLFCSQRKMCPGRWHLAWPQCKPISCVYFKATAPMKNEVKMSLLNPYCSLSVLKDGSNCFSSAQNCTCTSGGWSPFCPAQQLSQNISISRACFKIHLELVTLITVTLAGRIIQVNYIRLILGAQVGQFYIKPLYMCNTSASLKKASYFPSLPLFEGLLLLSCGSRFRKSELSQLKVIGAV